MTATTKVPVNFKKVWGDPVWSKVISVGIIFLISTLFASVNWWTEIRSALSAGLSFLTQDVPTPRWFFWLLVIGVAVGISTWGAVLLSIKKDRPMVDPTSYKKDVFFGIRWRWTLNRNMQPFNLAMFCPVCDCQLDVKGDQSYFSIPHIVCECFNCKKTAVSFDESIDDLESRVERLVQMKLRDGSWAEVLKNNDS
jgi:hypothetical protein